MLNAHFTNVIIKKVIKTKFVNIYNYRAYGRMKNKIITMEYKTYFFIKEWFGDSLSNINHQSLKKTKLNFSVIVVSENKQSWFVFNFFNCDWQVSSLTHAWNDLTLICMKYHYLTYRFAVLLWKFILSQPCTGWIKMKI